jgi:hypothetical protein
MRMPVATEEVQAMQDETNYCFTDFYCGAGGVGLQKISQQQHNTAREEAAFPTRHSSQDSVCRQGLACAAFEPPSHSLHDTDESEDESDNFEEDSGESDGSDDFDDSDDSDESGDSDNDSTCSFSLKNTTPREISISLRPCSNALPIDSSIRMTPSEWARYLDAQFETDPSYTQYRAHPFTYSVLDHIPMTYKQMENIMLYPPRPATEYPAQELDTSSHENDAASDIAQESAKIEASLGDSFMVQGFEAPSGNVGDKQKCSSSVENDNPTPQADKLDIPKGADNCLAGLTFLFTGQLKSVSREEAQDLVKRYGAKITLAPTRRTDYVVLGAEAAPKKLATIKEHNLRTIDEKVLLRLISCLPARACSVPGKEKKEKEKEQKEKEAASVKNVTENVLTTTPIPFQRQDAIFTATPSYRLQQQTFQVQDSFPLSSKAKASLKSLKIFPPTTITLNTPECENYKNSVISILTTLASTQVSGIKKGTREDITIGESWTAQRTSK